MPMNIPEVIGGEELLAKRSAVDAEGDLQRHAHRRRRVSTHAPGPP
jgi:hypothetical protein